MKKFQGERTSYSVDMEVSLKDKKQLALLVNELETATSGATYAIPNNDFRVNVFEAGFLGDKFGDSQTADLEESMNVRLKPNMITSFDVVPLEVGMMANAHSETLSLGISSVESFKTFRMHVLAAMQRALEEMRCERVSNLSNRDLRELTTQDNTRPRVDLAHYSPNILGLDPTARIIEYCFDSAGISYDKKRPTNPLSLVPGYISIRGLSLTRHTDNPYSYLPGHAEKLDGDFDKNGRKIRKFDWAS